MPGSDGRGKDMPREKTKEASVEGTPASGAPNEFKSGAAKLEGPNSAYGKRGKGGGKR